MTKWFIAVAALLASNITAHGATYGNWEVKQTVDKMTDKRICYAHYYLSSQIELVADGFTMKIPGGLVSYQYRLDNGPVEDGNVGTLHEELSLIWFPDDKVERIVATHRMRLRIFTWAAGIKDVDLDMTGITDAYNAIRRCQRAA